MDGGDFLPATGGRGGFLDAASASLGGWGTASVGVTYQSMDAFEEGDSSLDGDGDGLQTVMITGGLGLRF